MEILIVIVVALALAAVLGVPLQIILYIALGIVELICGLSWLLFIISACMLPFTKKKEARFLDIVKSEHGIFYAYYEIDGEKYRCLFPTDAFLKKLIYRKVDTKVLFLKNKSGGRVIDLCAITTIFLGLVLFALLGAFVGIVLIAL